MSCFNFSRQFVGTNLPWSALFIKRLGATNPKSEIRNPESNHSRSTNRIGCEEYAYTVIELEDPGRKRPGGPPTS